MNASTDLDARALRPGVVVWGRYRLGREVGNGASGRLHLATRVSDGRELVLKLLNGGGRFGRQHLRAEARSLAALEHRHVVRFVEHGECPRIAFIAMEAVRGTDLDARIAQGGVSRGTAFLWLYELAAALDHVHARGLVHRDIKPANVMIEAQSQRAVLVDFGLASDFRRPAVRSVPFILGTPDYMAPEQVLGLEADIGPAADRYALAAVALELLTGERAYPRMPMGRLLTTILEQPPRRPSMFGVGGPALDMVFARAMARDPSRRYPSARQQIEALMRALPSTRSAARPSRTPRLARTVRVKAA